MLTIEAFIILYGIIIDRIYRIKRLDGMFLSYTL